MRTISPLPRKNRRPRIATRAEIGRFPSANDISGRRSLLGILWKWYWNYCIRSSHQEATCWTFIVSPEQSRRDTRQWCLSTGLCQCYCRWTDTEHSFSTTFETRTLYWWFNDAGADSSAVANSPWRTFARSPSSTTPKGRTSARKDDRDRNKSIRFLLLQQRYGRSRYAHIVFQYHSSVRWWEGILLRSHSMGSTIVTSASLGI